MVPKGKSATGKLSISQPKEPQLAIMSGNSILSGPSSPVFHAAMINKFTCFAVSNTNGSQPSNKVYTDTDTDVKAEVITDV